MFRFIVGYPVMLTLIVSVSLIQVGFAWKPITGAASAFTSSFSLKQSHPDLSVKMVDSAEIASPASSSLSLSSSFPEHESRILTGPSLPDVSGELNSKPVAFKYDSSDTIGYGHPSSLLSTSSFEKRCAVKKFAFNHDGIVAYEHELPELKQFTICFWSRFTNHSGDHVILTYADKTSPRSIQIWIANSMNSSFISMAIKGQQVYRLNYPLRMRQWHHMCSSWNGKTGEWQVWMKSERISRGFHNALVGHKIPANGKLFSGGPSITGELCQGLHFEITFLQIYRIGLTAGKAQSDHKHHHVHRFDHNGKEISTTTRAPPPINRPQQKNNMLANGQLPPRVRINLARPKPTVKPPMMGSPTQFGFTSAGGVVPAGITARPVQAATIQTSFINGQINTGSRLVAQQLLGIQGSLNNQHQLSQPPQTNSNNIQFVDETEMRFFFKRHTDSQNNGTKSARVTRSTKSTKDEVKSNNEKNLKKRELVLVNEGVIVDNGQDSMQVGDYTYDGLAGFGDQQFKHDLTTKMNIDEEVSAHDSEPALDEVRAVMLLCSACETEPFQGAIVFAWKNVRESMDNALKGNSVGGCGDF